VRIRPGRIARGAHGAPALVVESVAAITAVNHLVLVTRNVRDFSGFTGLKIESWSTGS
jgi:predicted nucleic acid-binding protein